MIKITKILMVLMIACPVVFAPALGLAKNARQISWEDLIPAELLSEDPVLKLSEKDQNTINAIIYIRDNIPETMSKELQEYFKQLDDKLDALKEKGVDIDKIIAFREKFNRSVVKDLNNENVSIPGYLLPLEMTGTAATEFLLVPYVGACIHAPPPPPNQIIHVVMNDKKGYISKTLFHPVWVTGVLSCKPMEKKLFLKDGSDDISIGYSMTAQQVKEYKR